MQTPKQYARMIARWRRNAARRSKQTFLFADRGKRSPYYVDWYAREQAERNKE